MLLTWSPFESTTLSGIIAELPLRYADAGDLLKWLVDPHATGNVENGPSAPAGRIERRKLVLIGIDHLSAGHERLQRRRAEHGHPGTGRTGKYLRPPTAPILTGRVSAWAQHRAGLALPDGHQASPVLCLRPHSSAQIPQMY